MPETHNEPSAYRGLDLKTLRLQYDARASVPSYEAERENHVLESKTVQSTFKAYTIVVYDEPSGQKLDIYRAGPDTPIFLWMHGGYWRSGSRSDNAFAAGGLVRRGVSVAVMDYSLAPNARIGEIVRQVRSAVQWLTRNGVAHGLRVQRIHVGGTSAGGQLTGMLLASGWMKDFGLDEDIFGAALALNGIYDLVPLQYTDVNEWMRFTAEEIEEYSPARWIPIRSQARLIASVGGLETDEFKRQTADFANAWKAAGHSTCIVDMPNYNHFNIARSLTEPFGHLVNALCKAIIDEK
jgi:arylformamidase